MQALLDLLAPGSAVASVEELPGSYSDYTHLVAARDANGVAVRFVLRRYAVFGNYDRGEKASREFNTLELVRKHGIPAP